MGGLCSREGAPATQSESASDKNATSSNNHVSTPAHLISTHDQDYDSEVAALRKELNDVCEVRDRLRLEAEETSSQLSQLRARHEELEKQQDELRKALESARQDLVAAGLQAQNAKADAERKLAEVRNFA